jgi:hypothetical protein
MRLSSKMRKMMVTRIDNKDVSQRVLLTSIQVSLKDMRVTGDGGIELQARLAISLRRGAREESTRGSLEDISTV